MSILRRLANIWYPWLGAIATSIVAWRFHAECRVFHSPAVAIAVFGGLLTFSALLASVLLALLAIIASLDNRPIVQDIRRAGHYPELVNSAFSPLSSFIMLAAIALASLLIQKEDHDSIQRGVVAASLAFTTAGILSTYRFAHLLVRLMTDPSGVKPPLNPKDTPAAAAARGAGSVSPPPGTAAASSGVVS